MNITVAQKTRTFPHFFFLLFSISLFVSCGKQAGPKVDGKLVSKIITGNSVDWKDITTLANGSPERINSKAVGVVNLPSIGSRCTGFLINRDTLMTNHHCVTQRSWASGITVSFNYESDIPNQQRVSFDCSTFIGNNQRYDFALLKCAGNPGDQLGWVTLDDRAYPSVPSDIYVLHQNCDYYLDTQCDHTKKFSPGKVIRKDTDLVHDADTLGGSSGSPVFSFGAHHVIGLHHAGRGNNGLGRGLENYAVPMKDVVEAVLSEFPQVELTLASQASGGGEPDPTPIPSEEPNDDPSSATSIELDKGYITRDIAEAGDIDFYKVVLTESAELSVSLLFQHRSGDLDLALFDTNGSQLGSSVSVSDHESIVKNLDAGVYYIKVYGYREAMGHYQVQAKQRVFISQVEPNNSLDKAFALQLPVQIQEKISDAADRDYYKFEVSEQKEINIQLSFSHAQGDLDLYLKDASGVTLKQSITVSDHENIRVTLNEGTYTILVLGYRGAEGDYTLGAK